MLPATADLGSSVRRFDVGSDGRKPACVRPSLSQRGRWFAASKYWPTACAMQPAIACWPVMVTATDAWVDHVWDTRPRGHGRRDEGAVGLMLEVGGQQLGVFLGPRTA
jgi:hypothetical protein